MVVVLEKNRSFVHFFIFIYGNLYRGRGSVTVTKEVGRVFIAMIRCHAIPYSTYVSMRTVGATERTEEGMAWVAVSRNASKIRRPRRVASSTGAGAWKTCKCACKRVTDNGQLERCRLSGGCWECARARGKFGDLVFQCV